MQNSETNPTNKQKNKKEGRGKSCKNKERRGGCSNVRYCHTALVCFPFLFCNNQDTADPVNVGPVNAATSAKQHTPIQAHQLSGRKGKPFPYQSTPHRTFSGDDEGSVWHCSQNAYAPGPLSGSWASRQ